MKFDDAQKQAIDQIVEARLQRERRLHERQMCDERTQHGHEVQTLRAAIARLESERSVLRRLADTWFRARAR